MTLSTTVAVLYGGNLQQLDTPQRIYTHPANQFVAGFVGSPQMNLLTLTCRQGVAWLGSAPFPLPPGYAASSTTSSTIVLGIRPEQIHATIAQDPSPEVIPVLGEVMLVENLGMQALVSIQVVAEEPAPIVLRALLPVDNYTPGDRLTLAIPLEAIHWFDPQTGDRLA